ncbi:MAG: uridine kinase [Clostridia bacterium]|nr:uridine kinase [Clostridia bacterium]
MIIVGICGGTSSGKSTLANRIKGELSCSCVILNQDCYYFDQAGKPMEERAKVNYDSPEIFDHDELFADVSALLEGKPITKKGYDFPNHCRADSEELIDPPEVLIIEGIHAFYDERLLDIMDLKVYMRVDTDICLLRRIDRDMKKRGRSLESIAMQYRETVKPMYDKYISKYIDRADFAVMRGGKNVMAADAMAAYIEKKLNEKA